MQDNHAATQQALERKCHFFRAVTQWHGSYAGGHQRTNTLKKKKRHLYYIYNLNLTESSRVFGPHLHGLLLLELSR